VEFFFFVRNKCDREKKEVGKHGGGDLKGEKEGETTYVKANS
jgi:hypothetical protein